MPLVTVRRMRSACHCHGIGDRTTLGAPTLNFHPFEQWGHEAPDFLARELSRADVPAAVEPTIEPDDYNI